MMNIQKLETLSLEQKIGQLFMLAFAGNRLDEARVLIEEHYVGGCYISNDNVPTPETALELSQELHGYAANINLPLLLAPDQEGTWGVMVPGSSTGPGNMALGATHNPEDAYAMYKVIGQELSSVGLNTLLAPCADCNSNPYNSIIGMRSFGETPELVGTMTAAAVKGARDGGVLTTVKHFPGHGDTRLDSHRGLPKVERSKDELFAIDLHPFAEGINAGVDLVMTSHIIFTALDDKPATLSSIILQDVLRGELGFDGVIVSDSMNMKSMKQNYDPADSAVQALKAGVDIIMLAEEHYDHDAANYLKNQLELIGAVKKAVEDGKLPIERVNDAVRRILNLKAKISSEQLSLEPVGSEANRQVELEVSEHAVAILHNEHGLFPLSQHQALTLVNTTTRSSYEVLGNIRGIGPNQTKAAFDFFAEAVQERVQGVRVLSAEEVLADKSDFGDSVVVAVTENHTLPGMDFDQQSQVKVIERLNEQVGDRLVVAALRDPYELNYLNVQTYLCAFSFRPSAAQAAVRVLFGETKAVGKSPVSVPSTDIQV